MEVQNQPVQAFECNMDGNLGGERSDFEFDNVQNVKQESNIDQEDGWTWKRWSMIDVYHTICSYCRDKHIPEFRKTLLRFGDDTLNEFKSSCFGHFLRLPDNIVRCNKVIHYVISREIKWEGGDESELWFRINDTNLRFSRFEYALVTGLRFGASTFNPNELHPINDDSFYSRILKKKPIYVLDLWDQFVSMKLGHNASDYVKVAKILFAYFVLFGYDCRKIIVAEWLWALVEDTEAWESFPWGSYSYQILLFYIKRIHTEHSGGSNKRESYHFYGFSTAFLAWIYCAIPQFGDICGGISSKSRKPRILRFLYNRLNLDISNITGKLHPKLEPTDREIIKRYWTSVEDAGTPFSLQFSHFESNFKRRGQKQTRIPVVPEDAQNIQGCAPRACSSRAHPQLAELDANAAAGSSHVNEDQPTHSTDPRHQRQTFIQEVGDYIADQVMLRMADGRQTLIQEVGDYVTNQVMLRMADVLPRYVEFMKHEDSKRTSEFENGHDTSGNDPIHNEASNRE